MFAMRAAFINAPHKPVTKFRLEQSTTPPSRFCLGKSWNKQGAMLNVAEIKYPIRLLKKV